MSTTELLAEAVTTIDLLQSIYFDKEFEFQRKEDQELYLQLHACWESDTWTPFENLPSNLEFTIKAPIEIPETNDNDEEQLIYLTFKGGISLKNKTDYQLVLPSASNLWLSREDHETLVNTLNNISINDAEDRSTWIIEKMQQLQSVTEPYAIAYADKVMQGLKKEQLLAEGGPVTFLRDWIWFPMIYTREKVYTRLKLTTKLEDSFQN